MLHVTPEALIYLRTYQAQADERMRRRQAALMKPKRRLLNKERFARLVESTVLILRAGEPTRFAFEGACHHGLRVSLIMQGWRWSDADLCAADVVAAALKDLGAERPSWQQGQPEYVMEVGTARYFCARCGGHIPDDRVAPSGRPVRYCSGLCATVAYNQKARRFGEQVSMAEWLATCAEKSRQTIEERSGNCERCGTPFLTLQVGQKFCSRQCYHAAQQKWQPRPCQHCSEVFTPKNSGKAGLTRFCSRACSSAAQAAATPKPEVECGVCKAVFRKRRPSEKRLYCSPECSRTAIGVSRRFGSAFTCAEVA